MARAAIVDVATREVVNIAVVGPVLPDLPYGLAWLPSQDWGPRSAPVIGGTWNGDSPATFTVPQE